MPCCPNSVTSKPALRSTAILMKLVAVRLVEEVIDCLQTDYTLPCTQEQATWSYPQPDKSNPCPPLIYVRSNLILFLHPRLGLSNEFFTSGFPARTLYVYFLFPYVPHVPLVSSPIFCICWAVHVFSTSYLVSSTRVQHIVSGEQHIVSGEQHTCSACSIWLAVHVFSTSYLVNSTRIQHVVSGEQYTRSARRIWWAVHVFSTSYLVSSTRVHHVVSGEQYTRSARRIWWAVHVFSL